MMGMESFASAVRAVSHASSRRGPEGVSDAELLGRFVADQDEAAFEALYRRHGPMVAGVCRRILGTAADADDAFQATFLILVRRAASVSPRSQVGNWLHGVAWRVARKMISSRTRRGRTGGPDPATLAARERRPSLELREVIDRALQCLPEKFRAAVILCELEGRTIREVASLLGCPPGTVASRLARGRDLLRRQLDRSGLTAPAAGLAAALGGEEEAAAFVVRSSENCLALAKSGVPASSSAGAIADSLLRGKRFMRSTKAFAVAALLTGIGWAGWGAGGLPAPAQGKDEGSLQRAASAVAGDSGGLSGTWRLVAIETPGHIGRDLVGSTIRVGPESISGDPDAICPATEGHRFGGGRSVRIPYRTRSNTIELLPDQAGTQDPFRTGTYEVEGDRLTVVWPATKSPPRGSSLPRQTGQTVFVNRRSFVIPFQTAPGRKDDVRRLRLYVAEGNGPWKLAAERTPELAEGLFDFRAERDGDYRFSIQTEDTDGTLDPPTPRDSKELLRVVIDTEPPNIALRARRGDGDTAGVEWVVRDANLDDTSVRVEGRWPDQKEWAPIPGHFQPVDDYYFRLAHGERYQVRVVARDRAGNVATSADVVTPPTDRDEPAAPPARPRGGSRNNRDDAPAIIYRYERVVTPPEAREPVGDSSVDRKLNSAFPGGEAVKSLIKLDLRSAGLVIAAGSYAVEDDGRLKLTPCWLARFPRGEARGPLARPTTLSGRVAYVEFDRPLRQAVDWADRKVVAVEVDGTVRMTFDE